MNKQTDIIKYYETCDGAYRKAWDLNNSMSLHYGFWEKGVKNLAAALQKENEVLANIAKISAKDKVLDAGCGVGGSSIYLAKNIGCKVTGITISEKQVQEATLNAQKNKIEHLINFHNMDFTKTEFKDNTFDVIWAIESVCYAFSKKEFLQEVFRILKPKGRIIIADGFNLKTKYSRKEQNILDKMNSGWQVESLENINIFQDFLTEIGFKNILYQSANNKIMPSAKKLYLFSLLAIPYGKIEVLLKRMSEFQLGNAYTAHYQYKGLKRRLWEYGIFYAEK